MDNELFFDIVPAMEDALNLVQDPEKRVGPRFAEMALTNAAPIRNAAFDPHAAPSCTLADWFISGEGNNWPVEVQALARDAMYAQVVTLTNIWTPFGSDAGRFICEARLRRYIGREKTRPEGCQGMEDRAYTLVDHGVSNMERFKALAPRVDDDPYFDLDRRYGSPWHLWFAQVFDAARIWRKSF